MSYEKFKSEIRGKEILELKAIEGKLKKELMDARRKIAILQRHMNQKINKLNLKRTKK